MYELKLKQKQSRFLDLSGTQHFSYRNNMQNLCLNALHFYCDCKVPLSGTNSALPQGLLPGTNGMLHFLWWRKGRKVPKEKFQDLPTWRLLRPYADKLPSLIHRQVLTSSHWNTLLQIRDLHLQGSKGHWGCNITNLFLLSLYCVTLSAQKHTGKITLEDHRFFNYPPYLIQCKKKNWRVALMHVNLQVSGFSTSMW